MKLSRQNAGQQIVFFLGVFLLWGEKSGAGERFDYHSVRRPGNAGPEDGRFEGESYFVPAGRARIQGMRHYGPHWSGDAHLLWDGPTGAEGKVRFEVPRDSVYRLRIQFTRAVDYGVFQILLDGQPIGQPVDLYSTRVELSPLWSQSELSLKAGEHLLGFRLEGGNPKAEKFQSRTYLLGVDYIDVKDEQPVTRRQIEEHRKPLPRLRWTEASLLLRKHCHECHSGQEPSGGIDLAAFASRRELLSNMELVGKVADALAFGSMPPEDAPQPDSVERRQLFALFDELLEEFAGKDGELDEIVMRRMTRYEYNNAVRDLLRLQGDIYPLPERTLRAGQRYYLPARGVLPRAINVGNRTLGKNQVERQILTGVSPFSIDLQAEHGFNNRGDQLSISPLLLETFVDLSEAIVASPEFPDYCEVFSELFEGSKSGGKKDDFELARSRLQELLGRAFRAPVDPITLARYQHYFEKQYETRQSFQESMKRTVAGILASPRFLFLSESRSASNLTPLSDFELASRLSFFLWSSIPDSELLELARESKLSQPAVLERQVRRMLEDPRSQALSENFARQWLQLDSLITSVPDPERFPRYYSRIGCEQWKFGLQMMVEPLLLFESIVVEDRSIMLLIDSNYSYRSAELQSWYQDEVPFGGKDNIRRFNTGQQAFVRRRLATRRQGGVITTAAVMTMTSSPLRTSPITRGSWVATVILNQPPAPPPDTVPEIEADDNEIEAQGITLRQRLKQHQLNESCAACHAKIDPLGFALENYNAVGRWRDAYRSGLPIDSSGQLFAEHEFTDIESFKDALLDHSEVFIRGFSKHLLSYALGREVGIADRVDLDRMIRHVQADHGRFSTLVVEVVKSRAFRHKTSPSGRRSEKIRSQP